MHGVTIIIIIIIIITEDNKMVRLKKKFKFLDSTVKAIIYYTTIAPYSSPLDLLEMYVSTIDSDFKPAMIIQLY